VPATFVVKSGSEFGVSDGLTLAATSWSAELGRQLFERAACANSTCDGLFGLTMLRAASGWRLLSLDRSGPEAVARSWRMGDATLPEGDPLFGPEFSGLVSAFALRPSRDGKRAVFANGHRVVTREVMFAALDPDGRMVAPASTLELPSESWDDVTVVPTENAATVSVTVESADQQQRTWFLRELNSDGEVVFAPEVALPTGYRYLQNALDDGNSTIVEDTDGYYAQLVSNAGPSQIVQLRRALPNELVRNDNAPPSGALVGALAETLVFRQEDWTETTTRTRFVGAPKSGVAAPRTLVVTPALNRDLNAKVHVIAVGGNSLIYSFQSEARQIIEEVACSASP